MIPILFVDHAAALGGAEYSLLSLLPHLNRRLWQPHLACAPGPVADQATRLGLPCHLTHLPSLRRSPHVVVEWIQRARQLAALARQLDAAALYANTVRAALYVALAARLVRRPFIWHMRDFWLSEEKPHRLLLDRALKRLLCLLAHQVITNSHAVAQELPCRRHTVVVYNGIAMDQFDPAQNGRSFRVQYAIPPEAPVVGMVGRLRPWKGQRTFLHMAAYILQQPSDAYFVVVGGANFAITDDYPQQLQRLAQTLGITPRVIFTGALDDVRPALAAMDVFVHPGEPEPFGLVNIEAMAMARPVVGFAHGALPEIVQTGVTGILTPPGDIVALARAVLRLLENTEQRQQMGRLGRLRAETHFTIQHSARKISQLLRATVGSQINS